MLKREPLVGVNTLLVPCKQTGCCVSFTCPCGDREQELDDRVWEALTR